MASEPKVVSCKNEVWLSWGYSNIVSCSDTTIQGNIVCIIYIYIQICYIYYQFSCGYCASMYISIGFYQIQFTSCETKK